MAMMKIAAKTLKLTSKNVLDYVRHKGFEITINYMIWIDLLVIVEIVFFR